LFSPIARLLTGFSTERWTRRFAVGANDASAASDFEPDQMASHDGAH
jgi:hypothetical protein